MKRIGIGTFRSTEKMRAMIGDVLKSGQVSYGKYSLALEKRFAQLHQTEYAILSNSGTSALHVALQAMKEIHHWGRNQVIVPATTFVATPNIVLHNDMIPVFADVDPHTYNIDPQYVAKLVSDDTKAIIPVHLFGQPANVTALKEVLPERVKIIEDSCETMFVRHAGRSVGSLGDIGCFSMYVAHLLVAGVGGLSTTSNPQYAAKMRSLVNHGMMMEHLNPGENFAPQPVMGRRFQFDSVGHSYRITEFEAAVALAQLEDADILRLVLTRQRNARHLTQRLTNINEHYGPHFQTPLVDSMGEHSFMMYPIVLIDRGAGRKSEITAFLNERGIETRDMLPLVDQPIYRWLRKQDYPVSLNLIENGFYVGIHQDLSTDDIEYMADVFGSWTGPAYQGIHL